MDLASAAAKKHANAKVDTMAVRLIVAELRVQRRESRLGFARSRLSWLLVLLSTLKNWFASTSISLETDEIVLDSVEKNRRIVSGAPEQKLLEVLLQRKQPADMAYPKTLRALKSRSE